jgi:hypothetical protein
MYGKAVNKKDLENAFADYLKKITPKKKFLDLFKATVLNLWDEKSLDFKSEAQKYERQLAILEEKRKKIFEMREDGSYTLEEFRERKEEIENCIMATKISLDETRIDQFDIEGVLSYANNFIANLGRQWLDLSTSHSRFQKMVFPEGISYKRGEGFGTAKLGLIYELNQACGADKSLLVRYSLIHWNKIAAELKQWQALQQCFTLTL